jgi:hypothetical protein
MGINVDRTISLTFMLGGLLAGAAGLLLGVGFGFRNDLLVGAPVMALTIVAFVPGGVVQEPAVLTLKRPERGQARERPDEQRGERGAGDGEHSQARAAAHFSFARAARTMNGNATVEATNAERATSGAWNTTKRTISARLYSAVTIACRRGSRADTTASPPSAVKTRTTTCSGIIRA